MGPSYTGKGASGRRAALAHGSECPAKLRPTTHVQRPCSYSDYGSGLLLRSIFSSLVPSNNPRRESLGCELPAAGLESSRREHFGVPNLFTRSCVLIGYFRVGFRIGRPQNLIIWPRARPSWPRHADSMSHEFKFIVQYG